MYLGQLFVLVYLRDTVRVRVCVRVFLRLLCVQPISPYMGENKVWWCEQWTCLFKEGLLVGCP